MEELKPIQFNLVNIMVDIEKAVDFIKKNGSAYDIAKLNIILEKNTTLNKQRLLDYYIQLQNLS